MSHQKNGAKIMLNMRRIEELKSEVGEDDFAEVIELFCEEVEEALEALDTQTGNELGQNLHFLKGSALNIGFDQLGELCRVAEVKFAEGSNQCPDITGIKEAYSASRAAFCNLS